MVWQDARGAYTSEGSFTPKVNEIADGQDTAAWILEQDWSDGTIGTYGASYLGMTQWALATTGTPGLRGHRPHRDRRATGTRASGTPRAAPCP